MIIIAQNEVITPVSPWWNTVYVNPTNELEIYLGITGTDLNVRLAKLRSKKRTVALYHAILEAISVEKKVFNVNDWLLEFSSQESSKTSSKSS